jgi:hypothetical protein
VAPPTAGTGFTSAWQGALAAGGDPATSPLYVFGPFLALVVPAGVAGVTFGASIWLALLTLVTVSVMYRLVMRWVPDGTGGAGLSEEEFGAWAAKSSAALASIEYLLTFLVSMSALVTVLGDRLTPIRSPGVALVVALGLSAVVSLLVNRGPRAAATWFGPATAGVMALLWTMILAVVWHDGLQLPTIDARAFNGEYLPFTLGGFARILALMTGIEVFANLVAAYEGPAEIRARRAFHSMVIIMGTTGAAMLIVGPAILRHADVFNSERSVFTQTMDSLLPGPLAWAGTAIGAAVLLSASATALQGIQHLAHGLAHRRYVPSIADKLNRNGVATRPVWVALAILGACFVLFGTSEATYLALYAIGVFFLLSTTAWAALRRSMREVRRRPSLQLALRVGGIGIAALLTTVATVIVMTERFNEGAWLYIVAVPVLFAMMSRVRAQRGAPEDRDDTLGRAIAATCPCAEPARCTCAEDAAGSAVSC